MQNPSFIARHHVSGAKKPRTVIRFEAFPIPIFRHISNQSLAVHSSVESPSSDAALQNQLLSSLSILKILASHGSLMPFVFWT